VENVRNPHRPSCALYVYHQASEKSRTSFSLGRVDLQDRGRGASAKYYAEIYKEGRQELWTTDPSHIVRAAPTAQKSRSPVGPQLQLVSQSIVV